MHVVEPAEHFAEIVVDSFADSFPSVSTFVGKDFVPDSPEPSNEEDSLSVAGH